MAECPKCFESYPNTLIEKHLKCCTKSFVSSSEEYDEEEEIDDKVNCLICGARLN